VYLGAQRGLLRLGAGGARLERVRPLRQPRDALRQAHRLAPSRRLGLLVLRAPLAVCRRARLEPRDPRRRRLALRHPIAVRERVVRRSRSRGAGRVLVLGRRRRFVERERLVDGGASLFASVASADVGLGVARGHLRVAARVGGCGGPALRLLGICTRRRRLRHCRRLGERAAQRFLLLTNAQAVHL
jgi:hypothetical protein